MKKIPFTIDIRKKSLTGYLQTNDHSEPPKVFFVHVENWIVGNLICTPNGWDFEQVGIRLEKLTENERKENADYLGNIVVEFYE